jgi:site-specific recombinase XerD
MAVFRPAVLRGASQAAKATGNKAAALSPALRFHALRHPYASLCVAAGLDYMSVCWFMGASKPTTTLAIYTHLLNTDDHSDAMAARRDGRQVEVRVERGAALC